MTTEQIKLSEAMIRAADWLEAHPENHNMVLMASKAPYQIDGRASFGDEVSTLSPEATCWCALGRTAYELSFDTEGMASFFEVYAYTPDSDWKIRAALNRIWNDNDDGWREGDRLRGIWTLREAAILLAEEGL